MYDLLPDVLTAEEAAEYLKISKKSIYSLLQDKQIRHRKIGRIYRISKAAIEEYLQNA